MSSYIPLGTTGSGASQQGKRHPTHSKSSNKLNHLGTSSNNNTSTQGTTVATNSGAPGVVSPTTNQNGPFSATNLPELLFRLEPPLDYGDAVFAPLRHPNGNIRLKPNGQPYQQFPWLPSRIPIDPEPFLLEYWNKKHPDCSYADFEIRMRPGPGERIPARNTLNMRRIREVRLPLNIPSWLQKGETVTLTDCLIFESLSLNSIRRNTVLPVKPWGLLKPSLPGASLQLTNSQNVVGPAAPPAPPSPLPLRTFTGGKDLHIESAKLDAVKNITAILQDKAFERLLPHWIFLQDHEKPPWWKDRVNHNNTEDEVTIPLLHTVPAPARGWIKECVRDAAEPQNRLTIPPLSFLPQDSRGWIRACIREGRARSPIGMQLVVGASNGAIGSVDVLGVEDMYQSDLSVSLRFIDEGPGSEASSVTDFSNMSDASSAPRREPINMSEPEISERTEASWTEYWKRKDRARVVAEGSTG